MSAVVAVKFNPAQSGYSIIDCVVDIQNQLIIEGFNVTDKAAMKEKEQTLLLKAVFKHLGGAAITRVSQKLADEVFTNWPTLRKIICQSFIVIERLPEYIDRIREARQKPTEEPSTFWFRLTELIRTACLVEELFGGDLSRADKD